MSSFKPARVLAIHRYYWPDTPPYASLLRAIVDRWHTDGHHVEVLSSQPSYKPEAKLASRPAVEVVDNTTVRRISMRPDRSGALRRVFNLVWFPFAVAVRILFGRRYDVVMCSTAPPVLLGVAVSVAARLRRAQFVYHCMDLHPEIGALSGEFANPVVYRLMARLDRSTCRRATSVVVLSEDMRAALLQRDPTLAGRIVVLNNFELPDYDSGLPSQSPLAPNADRLRIAFTGNVGRFQGLEEIVESVLSADERLDGVELVLMGEGAAKAALRARVAAAPVARRDRVVFLSHGTPAQARALLGTAHVGLVSLTPNVIRLAYPSKTATYLSGGLPLLVAVEEDSELAGMVRSHGIGWHLPTSDAGRLTDRLLDLTNRAPELSEMSTRARAVWEREFSADVLLPRWSALLQELPQGVAS